MPRFTLPQPIDLVASLRPLVASANDPTIRLRPATLIRASRTEDGPVTLRVERHGEREVEADAFGPGRDRALTELPALLGAADDVSGFDPHRHPTVARAAHRHPGLRMVRSGRVEDVLVPMILGQRVTTREAGRSWTRLVARHGEPAPGPYGLRLPPSPARLASLPYWELHPLGVERARAERITRACRRIGLLQAALTFPTAEALARMTRVGGIGVWTAAQVLRTAGGHTDTVEVGDHGLKDHVAWNLAGEPRGDDERMLELLAPFAGHRGRVIRLLLAAGPRPPKLGPRRRVIPVDQL